MDLTKGQRPEALTVDIGELVLDGFAPGMDAGLVSAAFQAELGRLVREHGVPLAAGDDDLVLESLHGLPPLPGSTSARRLGEVLARSVHAGLSGRGRMRR